MNVKNFIAAAAFIATGTAFAAETPDAAAAAGTTATVATASAPEASQAPARKDDTADIVKEYKTPLAIQLDQYKN
ncbi:hypothetical protein [Massilia sp. SYSU DXS3249]